MDGASQFIIVTADDLRLAVGPDRSVLVIPRGIEAKLGLAPGIALALRLSPSEARAFAQALARKADAAEAAASRDSIVPFATPPDSKH